jgi:hypothetical protein
VAAIVAIVIGTLAVVCFALMVFMAMARRRRVLEETPSHTAYTNTTRYTPEGTPSNISSHDMKTNPYLEELSPNVSTSDVHASLDVVVPVDGHQTIIGLFEDFLEVPQGSRPNILSSLPPLSTPSPPTSLVRGTSEILEPVYMFTPPRHNQFPDL